MKKFFLSLVLLGLLTRVQAQEVTPRRWSHLPIGAHFTGTGAVWTEADIYFDPVLQAEDVKAEVLTVPVVYIYSFEWLNRSARIDLSQSYQKGTWEGRVNGVPTSIEREGLGDTRFRLAVNLVGAPPLEGKSYAAYRQKQKTETLAGAAMVVVAPTGEYYSDKLINLGSNRWVFRPQLGFVHSRNRWSYEVTSSLWYFSENNDFWQNSTRKQDPLLAFQGHVIYTLRPGCWVAGSAGYGSGAENTLNGVEKNDESENVVWALSAGLPIDRFTGLKLTWLQTETKTGTGSDTQSFLLAVSRMF
ncbi:transporter [Kiritimatiellaeota bacterium B1221]|nr:transporter [Kiritimatiellaeota bacterium B1221]